MHDASDLLLEAVANSAEAGACSIEATVDLSGGMISIRVEDDGSYTLRSDPFQDGSTTKGEGRGRGLALVKDSCSGRCRLTRGERGTVLEFRREDDGSFDALDKALLPIFMEYEGISVTIRKDTREFTLDRDYLEKRDAVPDRAGRIGRFRAIISSLKGEIYG